MMNHSPAQLIAELERLMDMDYELLPGARHVLIEAIAYIWPLVEKSDRPIGEVGARLWALLAHWQSEAARLDASPFEDQLEDQAWVYKRCANELDALLSAPVGNVCEKCGAEYDNSRATCINTAIVNGQPDACGGRVSAPVGSPPQEDDWPGCRAIAERITEELFINGSGQEAHRLVLTSRDGRDLGGWGKRPFTDRIIGVLEMASAPRGGGETR